MPTTDTNGPGKRREPGFILCHENPEDKQDADRENDDGGAADNRGWDPSAEGG